MGKVSKDDKIKLLEAKVSLLEAEVRVSALAYMLRYDKRTLDKRGRRIRNIDFLTALPLMPLMLLGLIHLNQR